MRLEKMNAHFVRRIAIGHDNTKKVRETKQSKKIIKEREILEQYFYTGNINYTATDVLNILMKNKIEIDTTNRKLAKALTFVFGKPKLTALNGRAGRYYFLTTDLDI